MLAQSEKKQNFCFEVRNNKVCDMILPEYGRKSSGLRCLFLKSFKQAGSGTTVNFEVSDLEFCRNCKPECKPNKKPLDNFKIIKRLALHSVVMDGIEPPTHRFSVYCSTD
jgi:hypothetical protein